MSGRSAPRAPAWRETARIVLWGLIFYASVELSASFLVRSKIASLAVGAAIAEWGAGRVGVHWSEPGDPAPAWGSLARRIGLGFALGLGACVVALLFACATGGAWIAPNRPIASGMVVGLVAAALSATRDELLFRGILLKSIASLPRSSSHRGIAIGACALAAGLHPLGAGERSVAKLMIATAAGAGFAALWQRDRGAWLAVGAHAAWAWALGSLLRGGLLDVRTRAGFWGGGDLALEGSMAVAIALTAIAGAGVGLGGRRSAKDIPL